jgi:glucose-6-phosphate dehydrogenase assembly protein OpcA
MVTQAPPIVSLQAPKDVSLNDIENELHQIWQMYNDGESGSGATRATTFTFVVYEPEETQQLLAALGFYQGPIDGISGPLTVTAVKNAQKEYGLPVTGKSDSVSMARFRDELAKRSNIHQDYALIDSSNRGFVVADAIAAANPCRIIAICPHSGEDQGVQAQVSAYCPMDKKNRNTLICCEYITITGTTSALDRIGGIVSELMSQELPKYLWWKATPDLQNNLFKRLTSNSTVTIFDSAAFGEPEPDLLRIQTLKEEGYTVADLNWQRIAPWQELTAEAFDPPEKRAGLSEIDQVAINYEKGNPAQAFLFLGWLASRLQWRPVSYVQEGGDYDLKRIKFVGKDQRAIEAELAGIPVADWGDIPGDLDALKLSSTNPHANCGIVVCSATSGCMRMEAGGGAQSYEIMQVSPLTDQKAEFLISQQLKRWGGDMLFEESLAITAQILKLEQKG